MQNVRTYVLKNVFKNNLNGAILFTEVWKIENLKLF